MAVLLGLVAGLLAAAGAPGLAPLAIVLAALAWIDTRSGLLPDALTLPLMAAGWLLGARNPMSAVIASVLAWAGLAGMAWLYRHLRGRDGFGGGDVKCLAALSGWLGLEAAAGILWLACVLGLFGGPILSGRALHRPGGRSMGAGPAGDAGLRYSHDSESSCGDAMFSIGLTGGIGSGKSKVADWLAEWAATVIDTDRIAHDLTAPGGAAIEPLRAAFGTEAIGSDGALDRDWMRARVFADPAARRRLESVLHPMIDRSVRDQAARARGRYLVFVVPLLVESGRWRDRVDRVCVVDCDPETQVGRVRARSGLTRDTIERIMSAQASRADRLAAADDVIVNDGSTDLDTLRQNVSLLHQAWCDRASRPTDGRTTHG